MSSMRSTASSSRTGKRAKHSRVDGAQEKAAGHSEDKAHRLLLSHRNGGSLGPSLCAKAPNLLQSGEQLGLIRALAQWILSQSNLNQGYN